MLKAYYSRITACLLAPLFFLFTACNSNQIEPLPAKERTSLHFLHAHSLPGNVDLRLITQDAPRLIADDVSFMESWPASGYASLLTPADPDSTGRYLLRLEVLKNSNKTLLVPEEALSLLPNTAATLILIDSFGKPLLVRTIDNYSPSKGDTANVRYMNLNYTYRSVSLETKNAAITIPNKNFLNFSSYKHYPTGVYTFLFKDDITKKVLDSIPNFSIQARKLYNFYLTNRQGVPEGNVEVLGEP